MMSSVISFLTFIFIRMFLFYLGPSLQRKFANTHPQAIKDALHPPIVVGSTYVDNIVFASFVNIHSTVWREGRLGEGRDSIRRLTLALKTLPKEAEEQRTAVITISKFSVIMNFKQVGNIGLELSLGTRRDDLLLAPLVDNTGADLTLVTLLTNTPNKIPTVRTKSWLL